MYEMSFFCMAKRLTENKHNIVFQYDRAKHYQYFIQNLYFHINNSLSKIDEEIWEDYFEGKNNFRFNSNEGMELTLKEMRKRPYER